MKVLIIGGSRFVGPRLIDKLLVKQHEITVFNRGQIQKKYPSKVKFIQGDREEGFYNKVKGKFDVVIDMCAYNGKQTDTAINELRFDYFLHLSTAAVYQKSERFPLTEGSTLGPWPVWEDYNTGKIACEDVLAHGGVKYGSIRPVYILGANNYVDRERFIYSKIKQGKITLPGNGQALVSFVHIEDVVDAITLMAERQATGAYNCASDEIFTLKGLVELMANIIDKKVRLNYNSKTDGQNWQESEFPFANENFVVSTEKIKKLGFDPLLYLYDRLEGDWKYWYKGHLK